MLEQIESTIVAFVLGAVLTYFTTRWSKTLKKINKLEYGVQALLRDRMLQMYSYYADNGSAPVTANDLRGVIAAAAVRSDALHTTYRTLKAQVQAAETVADVATIVWPED